MSTGESGIPEDEQKLRSPSQIVADMFQNLTPESKNQRRLVSGAALGACLTILLNLLNLPRLDQPLHIALIALAVAAPLLILDFYFAPVRPKGSDDLFVLAFVLTAWLVFDGIGIAAVAVGIWAIVWHLYPVAAFVLIGTVVGSLVIFWIACIVVLFILAWRKVRAEKKKKKSEPYHADTESTSLDP